MMKISDHATGHADIMLRHHLYSDLNDRIRHFGEIQIIADDLQRPLPEIAQVYEDVLEYLRARARIHDFLPIMVAKEVRKLCKRNH